MIPDNRFSDMPKSFWAAIRSISQETRYAQQNKVYVPSSNEIVTAFAKQGCAGSLIKSRGKVTDFGIQLLDYFQHRAEVLNNFVEPRLMDADRAQKEFHNLKKKLSPSCPIPMNKQKGDKRHPAFFTGMVNMLIEANGKGYPVDYDPRKLTTINLAGAPCRTLARRVDGAFPSSVNPVALWEIKEYYYTTTFGSRVADGVYETLLDGMELAELFEHQKIKVLHYLMVDAHYTWWDCGKSYLCRIVDMLHMGLVDEVLFGYEIIERLPAIVKQWTKILENNAT